MKKIAVYFNNGMRAYFEPAKLIFLTERDIQDDPVEDIAERDVQAVNWQNVCFVRAIEEEKEEE